VVARGVTPQEYEPQEMRYPPSTNRGVAEERWLRLSGEVAAYLGRLKGFEVGEGQGIPEG
jgi:hypothetical protein